MSRGRLEAGHESAGRLGTGTAAEDVALLTAAHVAVMPSLEAAEPQIAMAVDLVVEAMRGGGRLLYFGAGTSGWLAALDAAEVVVTFGMRDRVMSVLGGGHRLDPTAMTLGDDDVSSLDHDPVIDASGPGDIAIAVSASGRTPFTVAAVDRLRGQGARVIALVNDSGSPLEARAHAVIHVPVAGELVAGSTRLTAGMAQKVVLNTISTASMVRLGRTFNGQMVCVEPLNAKLRERIVRAVATAAAVTDEEARAAVAEAGAGDVAVVMLLTGRDAQSAADHLGRARGHIGRAVAS